MTVEAPELFLDAAPPNGWECRSLNDLIDSSRGISYGIVQPGNHDASGIPIVRVNNLRNGRIETVDVMRVSPDVEAKYERTRLRGGEVLLSLVGTLGECAVVPEELTGWNVARAIAVIPVIPEIDPRWIVTCLRSKQLQHFIHTWATTTVQATFNLRDVKRLPIVLPPTEQMAWMMDVIGSLDDKIELNRRTSRALESLARAIFQAWFVDFLPVHAKAAGATSFAGMPQEVFDTLPNTFAESELGPVPEGWEVGELNTVASLSRETINPSDYTDELFDHYSIPAFDKSGGPSSELGSSIKSNKHVVPQNCILVSKLNPRIPRVWLPTEKAAMRRRISSTEFMVALPSKGWTRYELYCHITSSSFIEHMTRTASGTSNSHQRVKPKDFEKMPLVFASEVVRTEFSHLIEPIFQKIENNQEQSRTLAALRDTLLPKLISGELRVGDVA